MNQRGLHAAFNFFSQTRKGRYQLTFFIFLGSTETSASKIISILQIWSSSVVIFLSAFQHKLKQAGSWSQAGSTEGEKTIDEKNNTINSLT